MICWRCHSNSVNTGSRLPSSFRRQDTKKTERGRNWHDSKQPYCGIFFSFSRGEKICNIFFNTLPVQYCLFCLVIKFLRQIKKMFLEYACKCDDFNIIHFSDVTLLFEQWIIFKNLQFILLFLNIWTLTFYCFRLKKRVKHNLGL